MVHLLQLAQRIRVQVAVAADEMQLAQQIDGLSREQLAPDRLASCLSRSHRLREHRVA
jgi:hypothetical protein